MGKLKTVEKYESLGLDDLEGICMHGMCQILSGEVEKALGYPQQIVVDYDDDVEQEVLVHAYTRLGNKYVDASGIHDMIELPKVLQDEFEELDRFREVTEEVDVRYYFKMWENNLPLSTREDFLMAWGEDNVSTVEAFLKEYVKEVAELGKRFT